MDSDDDKKNEIGFIWIIATFYVPLFAILIYNTLIYVSVYMQVHTWKVPKAYIYIYIYMCVYMYIYVCVCVYLYL